MAPGKPSIHGKLRGHYADFARRVGGATTMYLVGEPVNVERGQVDSPGPLMPAAGVRPLPSKFDRRRGSKEYPPLVARLVEGDNQSDTVLPSVVLDGVTVRLLEAMRQPHAGGVLAGCDSRQPQAQDEVRIGHHFNDPVFHTRANKAAQLRLHVPRRLAAPGAGVARFFGRA